MKTEKSEQIEKIKNHFNYDSLPLGESRLIFDNYNQWPESFFMQVMSKPEDYLLLISEQYVRRDISNMTDIINLLHEGLERETGICSFSRSRILYNSVFQAKNCSIRFAVNSNLSIKDSHYKEVSEDSNLSALLRNSEYSIIVNGIEYLRLLSDNNLKQDNIPNLLIHEMADFQVRLQMPFSKPKKILNHSKKHFVEFKITGVELKPIWR